MKKFTFPITLITLAAKSRAQSSTITLHPAPTPPPGASLPIDHSFPSLGFEKSSFAEYAGNTTHPNLFSASLISNLQHKLGGPLWIRIGGTSADQDHYNVSQTSAIVRPHPPDPRGGLWGYSIGPSYFDSLAVFNSSCFIWQLAMAHGSSAAPLHLSADALTQSKKAIAKLGDRLQMLELGNEPNLYTAQEMRESAYGVQEYVHEAVQHERDIEGNMTGLAGMKYQALAYASGADQEKWDEEKAFDAGINANGRIGSVSWHYYQSVTAQGVTLRATLMNHTATVAKLARFIPQIRYLHTRHPGIDFVLGEVGSVIAPELKWDVQATFGNALWTVDTMLHCMTLNVTRMHMQSGSGFGYAPWNATHVRPVYYALSMVADFIRNNTGGDLRIKELGVGGGETLAAYAAYAGDVLTRLAVVNLAMWDKGMGTDAERPVKAFEIVVPKNVNKVEVMRLMAAGASETGEVSWGGVRWVKSGNGIAERSVANGTELISVDSSTKKARVVVRDSEAIVVDFLR